MALVLSLIWRQIGSVGQLVRQLHDEGFLWTAPMQDSQQARSPRLRSFPPVLFARVFAALLPQVQARYAAVLAVDGATLDVLLRMVGLLRQEQGAPLAGRMTGLLDVSRRLPRAVWSASDAQAHDQRWWPPILAALPTDTLLLFDLGDTNFHVCAQLTAAHVTVVTRAKKNLAYQVVQVLQCLIARSMITLHFRHAFSTLMDIAT